jgi:hypothetical protein
MLVNGTWEDFCIIPHRKFWKSIEKTPVEIIL